MVVNSSQPAYKKKEIITFLLKQGADYRIPDNTMRNAFDYASITEQSELCDLLTSFQKEEKQGESLASQEKLKIKNYLAEHKDNLATNDKQLHKCLLETLAAENKSDEQEVKKEELDACEADLYLTIRALFHAIQAAKTEYDLKANVELFFAQRANVLLGDRFDYFCF